MSSFAAWLVDTPQSAVAVVTAILAAGIALLVAVLTQWILGRRARTELLTKKLEELYLALNEVAAHNVKRVEEALPLASALPFTEPKLPGSSVERHAHDLHKRIVMLVRLYFPKLSEAHQAVFRHNSTVNMLIYEAETGAPLSEERLLVLSGAYRDAVVAMEQELIQNRRVLVRDHLFPVRYKREAIRTTLPPPLE
jgi:hypothetical protein